MSKNQDTTTSARPSLPSPGTVTLVGVEPARLGQLTLPADPPELGLDPETDTAGRHVVRSIGESLVNAMQLALKSGPAEAAELVAGECVVHAETKDHLNWELLALAADQADNRTAEVLRAAIEEVEEQEDEHLYHSTGWTRELWLQSLGIPAVLPPPEERKHVTTAIGAARAKNARDDMATA